ncbi:RNA polymerase II-associated protein 1-like [Diadema setosum]|uniref:RNA polymerase II-associated protein 1-like n=1 Tax=Diadema setosum TaxID=31175 RepID=UPI003B3B5118
MNKRPQPGETEEDLLRLQEQFLAQKSTPSVKVKKADKRKASYGESNTGPSADTRKEFSGVNVAKDVVTIPGLPQAMPAMESLPKKRSKFKSNQHNSGSATTSASGPQVGQRMTFDLDDDEEDDPEAAMDRHDTHITAVLARIMEHDTRQKPVFLPQVTTQGFPTVPQRNISATKATDGKSKKKQSLFAQQFESTPPVDFGVTLEPPTRATLLGKPESEEVSMETQESAESTVTDSMKQTPTEVHANTAALASMTSAPSSTSFPASRLLDGSGLLAEGVTEDVAKQQAQDIHLENVSKMAAMSEEEILQEQARLKAMLDPGVLAFLRTKNQRSKQPQESAREESILPSHSATNSRSPPSSSSSATPVSTKQASSPLREGEEEMDTSMEPKTSERGAPTQDSGTSSIREASVGGEKSTQVDSTAAFPVEVNKKWLNMKVVEGDKLEWMSDLPKPSGKPADSKSQARFDFNGQLLSRNAKVPVREGLYHHGDEQEAPGYSLEELFTLSRSAVIQQRVLALQTLARVIYNYRTDSLGGDLKSPLISRLLKAGVLFLLRWAIDDSNEGVLSAGIEALAALIIQPGDEEALDKIYTWHQGFAVPPMLPQKREEGDEDNDDDDEEEEEDQKESKPDQHIASQDVIKGLLKMSLLPRLRYILEVVRPSPPAILNSLSILIRIARHSLDSALAVFRCPRLVRVVFAEFLPTTSWTRQEDPVSNLYGHPTVLAMKLIRVLCVSRRYIADTLVSKHPLKAAILRYTSVEPTNMNLNVAEAFHLSTESFRAWSACVRYGFACEAYREMYPLLMQQLQLFQRLSVLPLSSMEEEVTYQVHRLQLIRASALISLLEGVVQVAGTAAELQARFAMRNDATNVEPSQDTLSPPPIDWSHVTGLTTPLEACAQRWLVEMTGCTEVLSPEAMCLAGSALEFLATFYVKSMLQPSFKAVDCLEHIEEFVTHTLLPYMKSSSFHSAVHNLQLHSSLKYAASNAKRYSPQPLPSFSCYHDDSDDRVHPCVQQRSTLGYSMALFRLTHQLIKIHKGVAAKFEPIALSCYIIPYLENFCQENPSGNSGLAEHFAIHEHMATYFLIKIFQCVVQQVESCKHHSKLYHKAAIKLFARLHPGCEHFAHDLMSTVLFSTEFLSEGSVGDPMAADLAEFLTFSDAGDSSSPSEKPKERSPSRGELLNDAYLKLDSIRNLYMVYFGKEKNSLPKSRSRFVGRPHELSSLAFPPLTGPLLPLDWPFLPLVQLFSEAQKAEMKGQSVKSLPPYIMAAVTDTLRWVFMLETWRPDSLKSIPLAAKIARLYCVFLTAGDLFMEPSVHHYLSALFKIYTTSDNMKALNFDQKIPGLASFHDLYIAALSQYEAVSFGDPLFAHVVLLPLQQRFSVHLRKALWFDHIDVIRTLSLRPSQCLIPMETFLHPCEEEADLVEVYFSSLHRGKVRPTWSPIMHLVAVHHVVSFAFSPKAGGTEGEAVRTARAQLKIVKGILALQNEDLKQLLLLYKGPSSSDPKGYTLHNSLPQDRANILFAAERLAQERRK